MRKIDRLRKEALQSCTAKGHVMGRFSYVSIRILNFKSLSGYAECKVCGAGVAIETHPAPNSVDIGGSAVALNCPAEK